MKRILCIIGICAGLGFACASVTIPLYYPSGFTSTLDSSGDGPGSSTVDPIDPNQARAELTNNQLKVYEGLEGNVLITVSNQTNPQIVLETQFDQSVTLTLTDTATYMIVLKHPSIGTICGRFHYPIEQGKKTMQNGALYIHYNNCSYTPMGINIR